MELGRRRVAIGVVALVLFGGVVAVLRTEGLGDPASGPTRRPATTTLRAFAADGVLVPTAGERPAPPEDVAVVPGAHRLQLSWTGDAPGYEVRWGRDELTRTELVVRPSAQLDGLDDDVEHRVQVRAVDAFGQRSDPVEARGTPRLDTSGDDRFSLVDRFDGPTVPDPARWRLAKRSDCARATPGDGDDVRRLVVSSSCASTSVALRSRTPLVLGDGPELGRFVVETDAASVPGELLLDLVPGPVSLQGDALPPGAVRLRVATDVRGTTTADLLVGADVPRAHPVAGEVAPVPPPRTGLSSRWELVLRADGLRALRDGVLVAVSPAVPAWREATALIGVAGLAGGVARVGVDLVAFSGGRTRTPPLVEPPRTTVDVGGQVSTAGLRPVPGAESGQLRLNLVSAGSVDPDAHLVVGGVAVPLRPAVEGGAREPDVEYSYVADLSGETLVVLGDDGVFQATVVSSARVRVTAADLELTPAPGHDAPPPPARSLEPLNGSRAALGEPVGVLLDASGGEPPPGSGLTRGRLVLDVSADGLRETTPLAGLAGFEVLIDEERVAAVPTDLDGPAAGGRWRFALTTSQLSAGPHSIEIRAHSTDPAALSRTVFVPFQLRA
ncbi:fibronectin type III domain-containing protein [Umezawaea beigongshangensis]|uniref:fibronectin type III domain-containing protein n=1 Tax=Umezawaea beigongshangensis TaxID=2780383 RepID=UPI0018F1A2D3|nr:fibronectin type III domain-containing protein [Umezawaea beigongshangensis]